MLFRDAKTNFDEISKMLPGDYQNITQTSFSARSK